MYLGGRRLQTGFASILKGSSREDPYSFDILSPLTCLLLRPFLIKFLIKYDAISSPGCLASSCVRFLSRTMENHTSQAKAFQDLKEIQHMASKTLPKPKANHTFQANAFQNLRKCNISYQQPCKIKGPPPTPPKMIASVTPTKSTGI